MKKILYAAAFLSISLVFTACPYSSEVPIDKPSVKIDDKVMGVWVTDNSMDSTTKYTVSKADDYTYKIDKESTTQNETTITKYKAYLSDIGGVKFMNIWADDGNAPKYYLYKLGWGGSKDTLVMHEVTDNIQETFTTSDDLKKFMQTNMGLSFFFNKDKATYIRKG